MRVVRGVRRGCFAAAAVLAASALIAPAAQAGAAGSGQGSQDSADDRPGTWASRASATAIGAMFNTEPPQVTPEIVNLSFPDSDTQFDASIGKARASTLYPGLLVAQGANLTCQFSCAPVPPYPLSAYAENPQQQDAKIDTGQSVPVGDGGLEAGSANAHAGDDGTTSKATNGRFDISGGASTAAAALDLRRRITAIVKGPLAAAAVKPNADDASLLHVDAAVSDASNLFKNGSLVVSATATLKGVHLLGGQISIESIVGTATSTTDGEKAKVERSLTITGVSVAGQPARLDDKGITIGPSDSQGGDGFDALNNALTSALGAAGLDVHALTGEQKVDGGAGNASIEGVLISAKNAGVLGNGVLSALLLGKAGVSAAAAPFDSLDNGSGDLLGDLGGDAGALTDTGALGGGDNGALGGSASLPGSTSSAHGTSSKSDGRSEAAASQTQSVRPVAFVDGASGRLKTLYLALALAALGVALGWRRILPT